MKQIILITTLFILVSCGQGNKTETTKKSIDSEKGNFNQTNSEIEKISKTGSNTIAKNEPVDIALTFINSYIEDCNKMNKSVGYISFVNNSSLATNDFKSELKKILIVRF